MSHLHLSVLALLVLGACTKDKEEENQNDTETTETETDDTGLDTDTGTEPEVPENATLTIGFSGINSETFDRGEASVLFGSLDFNPSEAMDITSIQIHGFVNADPNTETYQISEDDGVQFARHFSNCGLMDASSTIVIGGVSPDEDGIILFEDSFTMESREYLHLFCDHTGVWPKGESDGFAVDFTSSSDVVAKADSGVDIEISHGELNGIEPEALTREPDLAKVLDTGQECLFEIEQADTSLVEAHNTIGVIIDPNSPLASVGNALGKLEVLRLRVENNWHSECSDVSIENFDIIFEGGDAEATGWLEVLDVEIVDYWTGDVVHSQTVLADGNPTTLSFTHELPAGETAILEVHVDASDASDVANDWIRASLAENSLDWSDTSRTIEDFVHEEIVGEGHSF